MGFQIAIDGPSGSGKSTVARQLAARLGFVYVDTGAMYRAVGVYCDNAGIDVNDADAVAATLSSINIEIKRANEGEQRVYVNGADVTPLLRTPRAAVAASSVAANSAVRERLIAIQRQLAQTANVIMDGRDICAYVLPNANVKIYLDASVEARVMRRCNELESLGTLFDYEKIKTQIIERDIKDKSREVSPLAVAEGAVVIDSSNLDIEGVIAAILEVAAGKNIDGGKENA